MRSRVACLTACTLPDARSRSRFFRDWLRFCSCLAFFWRRCLLQRIYEVENSRGVNNQPKTDTIPKDNPTLSSCILPC